MRSALRLPGNLVSTHTLPTGKRAACSRLNTLTTPPSQECGAVKGGAGLAESRSPSIRSDEDIGALSVVATFVLLIIILAAAVYATHPRGGVSSYQKGLQDRVFPIAGRLVEA